MLTRSGKLTRHPRHFRLNRAAKLARGLVFAGLGQFSGTEKYCDASLFRCHGALVNLDPASDWAYEAALRRWKVAVDADGYFNVPHAASLNLPQYTFAFWIRSTDTDKNVVVVEEGTNGQYVFQPASSGNGLFYHDTSNPGSEALRDEILDGSWRHVLFGFDGTNKHLYVDGASRASAAASARSSNTDALHIGSRAGSFGIVAEFADVLLFSAWQPSLIAELAERGNVDLSELIVPMQHDCPIVTAGGGVPPTPFYYQQLLGGAA
ncbi:MAG: LamG domain-containing protein [Planctomycetota bacterium]|jgi:hypothetical protein